MRDHGARRRPRRPATFAVLAVAAIAAAMLLPGPSAVGGPTGSDCASADAVAHATPLRVLRRAVSCLINHERVSRGLPHLDRDRRLRRAARAHNNLMLSLDCFSHDCPGEPDLEGRIRRTGYLSGARSWSAAENLGYDRTPLAVVAQWMGETVHRRNILDPTFEDFGVGVGWGAPVTGVDDHLYVTYTAVFGERKP